MSLREHKRGREEGLFESCFLSQGTRLRKHKRAKERYIKRYLPKMLMILEPFIVRRMQNSLTFAIRSGYLFAFYDT